MIRDIDCEEDKHIKNLSIPFIPLLNKYVSNVTI